MTILGLKELAELGLHFGHLKSRTHPRAKPFIFAVRNGVSVINLEKTQEKLKEAKDYVKKLAKEEKIILFICAKRQLGDFVREKAKEIKMPYTNKRFIGGTLTNFAEMLKNINRLNELIKREKETENSKRKKEHRKVKGERERLEFLLGGLTLLKNPPDALFIIDAGAEKNAMAEANTLHIPIAAIADTDADPSKIDYPIPANDDSVEGVKYIVSEIIKAYQEGGAKKSTPAKKQPKTKKSKK